VEYGIECAEQCHWSRCAADDVFCLKTCSPALMQHSHAHPEFFIGWEWEGVANHESVYTLWLILKTVIKIIP
jgi:hypothetical protein